MARTGAEQVEAVFRLAIVLTLKWLAAWMPRRAVLVVADSCGWILLLLPKPGYGAWRDARSCFGLSPVATARLTSRYLAQPLRDLVVLRRIALGREDPDGWSVRHENAAGVHDLLTAKKSFIVVTAHYAREAVMALFSTVGTAEHRVVQVAADFPEGKSLLATASRMQYAVLLAALSSLNRGKQVDVVYVGPRQYSPSVPIFRALNGVGTIVSIALDAPWSWRQASAHSFRRPFAGQGNRVFSLGALEIAQIVRCPVVACVPRVANDGTVVLKWGDPITDLHDTGSIAETLIEQLECSVGERPWQYLLEIGHERHWNHRLRRWEGISDTGVNRRRSPEKQLT